MNNSSQLPLFDTTAVSRTYKIGDFVKLKRKTPHAALLKRGDVVRIETLHPGDGSVKFWNERTESWGYLYSDEFVVTESIVETVVTESNLPDDSVTPIVETVVTESNLPDDSVTPIVETVVTESNLPDDSVTPIVETVVTESIVETVVTESNLPDDSVTSIVETVVTESNLPDDSVTKYASAISTYQPRGTARSGEYFRFSYRDGGKGKIRHIHIRGGNTDSPISQAKVQEVRSLLAAGMPPAEVAAMLRNSGGKVPTLLSG